MDPEQEEDMSNNTTTPPIKRMASGYNMFTAHLLKSGEGYNTGTH